MATFTATISASIVVFGGSPTTNWNEYNWGEALWGDGGTSVQNVFKVLENSQLSTSAVGKGARHIVATQVCTVVADKGGETHFDGAGYKYVFPKPTTDGEDRVETEWTES